MRRLVLISSVIVALGVVRFMVRKRVGSFRERMMERGMPRMMRTRFARMSPEQRTRMLTICRQMLDEMEATYGLADTAEQPAGPVEVH